MSHKFSSSKNENKKSESNSQEELDQIIKRLKEKDKVGVAGDILAPTAGAAAGVAASGAIASAAGATTIFGSTTLGSVLGGTIVASTPVGWVIGSAVALGAVGYGISKLIRSGSEQDQIRKELVEQFQNNVQSRTPPGTTKTILNEVTELLAELVLRHIIDEEQAKHTLLLLESGKLSPEVAKSRFIALLENSQRPAES